MGLFRCHHAWLLLSYESIIVCFILTFRPQNTVVVSCINVPMSSMWKKQTSLTHMEDEDSFDQFKVSLLKCEWILCLAISPNQHQFWAKLRACSDSNCTWKKKTLLSCRRQWKLFKGWVGVQPAPILRAKSPLFLRMIEAQNWLLHIAEHPNT